MASITTRVVPIHKSIFERLSSIAASEGKSVEDITDELLAETLSGQIQEQRAAKTFDEVFAPLQLGFEASGLTEDELGDLIDAEVEAYRAQRRALELPTGD